MQVNVWAVPVKELSTIRDGRGHWHYEDIESYTPPLSYGLSLQTTAATPKLSKIRNPSSSPVLPSIHVSLYNGPIHWPKARNFSETAAHAIDFGPGGLSGNGPLTASLDGGSSGVRVIVTGDKGKGYAELVSSLDIKYESFWNKKWAPGLVRTR